MTIAELETISALLDLRKEIKKKISIEEDLRLLASKERSLNIHCFNGKILAYETVLDMIDNKIGKIREATYGREQ